MSSISFAQRLIFKDDASVKSGVYEIVNTASGKRYIGSATNMTERFAEHRRMLRHGKHHSGHLQRSWLKHGASFFIFRPLLICGRDHLRFYEQLCLDGLDSAYNVCRVAISRLGVKNTPEHNAKIGAGNRGKMRGPLSEETRAKLSIIGLRANRPPPPMSPEVKARVDADKRGRKQSAETIARRVVGLKAAMADPVRRAAAVARLRAPEAKAKRASRALAATQTDEFRKQNSKRMFAQWADQVQREKHAAAIRASQDGSWKVKHAAGVARINQDKEWQARRNAAAKAPEAMAKLRASLANPICREKKSGNAKRQRAEAEEVRQRVIPLASALGEQLPNHRSGINAWLELESKLRTRADDMRVV